MSNDPSVKKDKEDETTGSGSTGTSDPSAFPVVGVGASAGGLEALEKLFESIPTERFSCVVVQHLDPAHESLLASILSRKTRMKVLQAEEGMRLGVNCVYTIPPDVVITLSDEVLHLSPRKEMTGLFLPIDRFFHSLAETFEERAIGIVLSGAGSDGAIGVQDIKQRGGIVFAQDEKSAKYFSMPRSAINTGAVDFVLTPTEIAEKLGQLLQEKYFAHCGKEDTADAAVRDKDLKEVLKFVYRASGVDFSNYKISTLSRRILRRMAFRKIESLTKYLKLLKEDTAEVKALCQDVLIQVTKFFREPESFELLKTRFFPKLTAGRADQDPIRIWVPGCSSGEEAYSILIVLTEYLSESRLDFPVQIFGTDINESAIDKARAGTYLESAVADISPERLRKFFVQNGHEYAVTKRLRDQCIFAKHNLLSDPPFAKLDLLSCQNVLIYFDAALQKRVLSIFHYALKPTGILLLGPSETVGAQAELFSSFEPGSHAYAKATSLNRLYFDFEGAQRAGERVKTPEPQSPHALELSSGIQVQKEIDRLLVAEFAPPGVIFNDRLEVLQFKGQTGPFLEHSPGFASLDLLKMLKGGLISDVRSTIDAVRKENSPVRKEGIKVRFNGGTKRVAIEIFPVKVPPSSEQYFLLTFEEMDLPAVMLRNKRRAAKKAVSETANSSNDLAALQAELSSTKSYLQSVNEEKEAANEELKAANEEIMSSNEELQSTNEELNTSKEELQSTNEELLTVNDELQHRNRELSQLNNDQDNLFTSLNVAVIMLSKDLRIRKFTPMAEKLLRLIRGDINRLVTEVRLNVEVKDLEKILLEVIRSVSPAKFEARDSDGKWYSVEIRPYRTSDDRIDGAILVFTDINQIKASLEYAEAIEETVGQPLLILTGDLKVKKANNKFYQVFKTSPKATEGQFVYNLGNGEWNNPKLKELLEDVLSKKTTFHDFELTSLSPGGERKTMRLNGRRLFHHEESTETILLAFEV